MGWDGSGNFTRTDGNRVGSTTWAQARDAGALINAPDADTHDQDLADGLENCVTKDGQNSPSANLPMNSKKHTGVADAAAATEYAAYGQLLALVSPVRASHGSRRDRYRDHAHSDARYHVLHDRQGLQLVHRDRQHRPRDGSRVGLSRCGAAEGRWYGFHFRRPGSGPSRRGRLQRGAVPNQHRAAD